MLERQKILIMGAAGRDFHNFNRVFRDDPRAEVVAFTTMQFLICRYERIWLERLMLGSAAERTPVTRGVWLWS